MGTLLAIPFLISTAQPVGGQVAQHVVFTDVLQGNFFNDVIEIPKFNGSLSNVQVELFAEIDGIMLTEPIAFGVLPWRLEADNGNTWLEAEARLIGSGLPVIETLSRQYLLGNYSTMGPMIPDGNCTDYVGPGAGMLLFQEADKTDGHSNLTGRLASRFSGQGSVLVSVRGELLVGAKGSGLGCLTIGAVDKGWRVKAVFTYFN